ncbi:flagellar hook-length control protein FliK [Billgrantia lactosivorans]|uniref:flagellar hook-length control protein FliK n=1 Tax=Billgrantia lactosivorans TaxID=2185141 RepID=UPI000DAF299D|nr:flagellar hook-length control protein FliK [Halomonas lactosivorans]
MNIQMILSTLPTPLSGKPQAGAGEGHFALALSQAGQDARGDGAALPISLDALPGQGLPQTMAAQQALLQALNANAGKPLDGEAEPTLPDAELSEIMARLALIEGTPQAPVAIDAQPLPEQQVALAVDELPAELAESPQAAPLAALAAEPLRPASTTPLVSVPSDSGAQTAMPAVPGPAVSTPAVSGDSLRAQLAAATAQQADGDAEAPTRAVEFSNTLTKASALQAAAGEPRAMVAEASRGGFVPESAPLAQPSTTPTAPTAAAPQPLPAAHASLAAPVQSPAWPNQLGQQLVQFARKGGEQQVELRLNPAELGPLSVTLKMTEQGAQAQFLSAHAQVRQVLEQAIPQLREALAEQGISLGETSVGEQRRQDGQAFAGDDGRGGQGAPAQGEDDLALAGIDGPGAAQAAATLSLDGRVNLYA